MLLIEAEIEPYGTMYENLSDGIFRLSDIMSLLITDSVSAPR